MNPAVARWTVIGVLLFLFVFGSLLLMRSMIDVLGTVRDDGDYPLVNVNRVIVRPVLVEVALTQPRGLDGELLGNGRAQILVAVGRLPDGSLAVVNAASPVDGEWLQLEQDRLVAPDGREWALFGGPIGHQAPPLQAFPSRVEDDLILADFTSPSR